ncbi:MAG: hypothetical protein ACKO87_12880, partial [Dolichospermum sp.]
SNIDSVLMPIEILNKKEKELLEEYLNVKDEKDLPQFINEDLREILPLRDTDKGFKVNTPHIRKSSKKR